VGSEVRVQFSGSEFYTGADSAVLFA